MKFGRRLQEEAYEPYRAHYIAYKELKKAIKLITGSDTSNCTISEVTSNFGNISAFAGSSNRPPEARFQDLLNFEVEKINSFSALVYTMISSNLQSALKQLQSGNVTAETLDQLFTDSESAADGVAYLHAYVRLNLIGFRKITKKYDKHSNSSASGWYLSRVVKEKFVNLNFDYLIELVAACFMEVRQTRKLHKDAHNSVIAQQVESSTTGSLLLPEMTHTTYLVSEDSIMEIRVYLAKHLPLVALGSVKCPTLSANVLRELSRGIPPRHRTASLDAATAAGDHAASADAAVNNEITVSAVDLQLEENTGNFTNPSIYKYEQQRNRISHTSIYFDHPTALTRYRALLSEGPTSSFQECLRLRWNEQEPSVSSDNYAVIELVCPNEPAASPNEWFDVEVSNDVPSAVPRALSMSRSNVQTLIAGSRIANEWVEGKGFSNERKADIIRLLNRMEDMLTTEKPIWQTSSHRTIYRDEENLIYAYLDEGIRFSSVDQNDLFCSPNNSFCGPSKPTGQPCPLGVLSLSQPANSVPAFLPRLAGLTSVTEVWGYSTLLHGTALLRRNQLCPRELPHWFSFAMAASEEEDAAAVAKSKQRNLPSPAVSGSKDDSSSAMRVDVMTTKPRERLMHEHAVSVQQEERMVAAPTLSTARAFHPQIGHTLRDLNEPLLQNRQQQQQPPQSVRSPFLYSRIDEVNAPPSSSPPTGLWSRMFASLASFSNLFPYLPDWFVLHSGPSDNLPAAATVRVEPKTFFANERTLLQWMNTAVLLSTISITLLNFGTDSGRLAGLMLSPVALFFIIYSFMVYLRRSYSLERKEPINYNDRLGPAILVLCLIGSLSAIIILNIMTANTPAAAVDSSSSRFHDVNAQVTRPQSMELVNDYSSAVKGSSIFVPREQPSGFTGNNFLTAD